MTTIAISPFLSDELADLMYRAWAEESPNTFGKMEGWDRRWPNSLSAKVALLGLETKHPRVFTRVRRAATYN